MRNKLNKPKQNITMEPPMIIPDSESTEIFADNHSLFIQEKPLVMEPIGEDNDFVYEQHGGFTVYKLFLGEFDETGNGLQRIISRLQESKPGDVLELHISSRGGVIDELIELYNICDTLFYNNVTTFCNHGYSAGAMAFLFGIERCVYAQSDWMMHSYSGGTFGKRADMIDRINHEDKRFTKFLNELLSPYFNKKELKKIHEGKDFWLNSEDLLKRGIATHILEKGNIFTAEEYFKNKETKEK